MIIEPTYDAVIHFHQPEQGYRFSEDSIALANFVDLTGVKKAADFGAGCGVVGLAALEKGCSEMEKTSARPEVFYFIEREAELLKSLRKNVDLYQKRSKSRLLIIPGDWRDLTEDDFGGPLDFIMANPPYFPAAASRPSPDPVRNAARREIFGGLPGLCGAIARLLSGSGRAAIILPAGRRGELEELVPQSGLTVNTVQPSSKFSSRHLIWELVRSGSK